MFFFVSSQPESSAVVVHHPEGETGGADVDDAVEGSVGEEEGELEVVQPSEEWQTLKPGSASKVNRAVGEIHLQL